MSYQRFKDFLNRILIEGLIFLEENMAYSVSVETIQEKILYIRGVKVLLAHDLAQMYGIETKQLKRSERGERGRCQVIRLKNRGAFILDRLPSIFLKSFFNL
jgi:hypothetical protein